MAADLQPVYEPWMFDIPLDVEGVDDDTQEFVLSQHTGLTPQLVDLVTEETPGDASSNNSVGAQLWQTNATIAAQVERFEQWFGEYPTRQQKKELLKGTNLTLTQLNGLLSRARQARAFSNKATKGRGSVRQTTTTDLSSNWSDVGRDKREKDDVGVGATCSEDYSVMRGSYDSTLEWWFDTCLVGVGSHFGQKDNLRTLFFGSQTPEGSQSDNIHSSSSDAVSLRDMFSSTSGSLPLSGLSRHNSARRQGKRVCAGSRSSKMNSQPTEILYHCTMCDTFTSADRGSWRRHENEQHVQPPLWICQPSTQDALGVAVCSFCHLDVNSPSCIHEVQKCWTTNNRAFQRKWNLGAHLQQIHNLTPSEAKSVLPNFQVDGDTDPNVVDLTCYFCGFLSPTWSVRQDHVGDCFRKKARTKAEWDARKTARSNLHFHGTFA